MDYAGEYSPDLESSYLASILNKTNEQERADVGNASREGESAGLIGQASTGSRVAGAVGRSNNAYLDSLSKFGLNVADKQYSERMTDEKQAFQASESQKDRDLKEHLTSLGYQFAEGSASAERGYERVTGQQGMVVGLGASLLSGGAAAGGARAGGSGSPSSEDISAFKQSEADTSAQYSSMGW